MASPSDDTTKEGWEPPIFKDSILVDYKADYIKKPKRYDKQKEKTCIICKIVIFDPEIPSFEICRNEQFIIFLNLYPFTNAHVMISPLNHITGYDEFKTTDLLHLSELTQRCIQVLKHNGNTESFNIGWNQGEVSGGSIKHFHIHIVPRYRNELNYMEIIAKTRPMIRSLEDTQKDLQKYSEFILGKKSYEDVISEL